MTNASDRSPYTDALDSVRLDASEKTRLTNLLAAEYETGTLHTRRPRRPRPHLVAALALAACIAIGAGSLAIAASITGTSPTDVLARFFGGAPVEKNLAEQLGSAPNAHTTSSGITVTLDSLVNDGYYALCTFSIAPAHDGSDPQAGQAFLEALASYAPNAFYFDNGAGIGISEVKSTTGLYGIHTTSWTFFDADPTDDALQYTLFIQSSEAPLTGQTLRFAFTELGTIDYGTLLTPDSDGNTGPTAQNLAHARANGRITTGFWEIVHTVDQPVVAQDLPVGQSLDVGDMTLTVTRATLSPLRLTLEYDLACYPFLDTSAVYALPITITLATGETLASGTLRGGVSNIPDPLASDDVRHFSGDAQVNFDRVVDPGQVASISIGDLVIPVDVASAPQAPEPHRVTLAEAAGHVLGTVDRRLQDGAVMGTEPGLACSSSGVTVTLDSVIDDSRNLYCVFTFARDDGGPLPSWTSTTTGATMFGVDEYYATVSVDPGSSARVPALGCSSLRTFDIDPNDRALHAVLAIENPAQPLAGRTVAVRLDSLLNKDGSIERFGSWAFEFAYDPARMAAVSTGDTVAQVE